MATPKGKPALSPLVIKRFCDLCRDTQSFWMFHKTIFDDNPDYQKMGMSKCVDFLQRLKPITHEYALHQIIKLHDPAIDRGSLNLTFDLIVKYGGWDSETAEKLATIQRELEVLLPVKDKAAGLGAARNKILSHNDLKTIIDDLPLGKFAEGNDTRYFEKVKEFLDLVREKWAGGPFISNDSGRPGGKPDDLSGIFIFEDQVAADAQELLNAIQCYDNKESSG